MHKELILAGFGGQGIMTMGTVLATAGMREGRHVTWLPSYGAEQRGGTANCTVVVSDEPIGSPIVDRPGILVAMNSPSLDKFVSRIAAGGLVLVNSSLVKSAAAPAGTTLVMVPANEMAEQAGSLKAANTVMLGVLAARTGIVRPDTLEEILREAGGKRGEKFTRLNLAALAAGLGFSG